MSWYDRQFGGNPMFGDAFPPIPRARQRYRRVYFDGRNFDEIEAFVGGDCGNSADGLVAATPTGPLVLRAGQWIVRQDDGTFTTEEQ